MAYETNRFCWQGCITTDVEASKAFYSEVIGWNVATTPMGDGEATMFAAGDGPLAHVSPPPMEGVPSHWENYIRVDDVDASAAAATANGGKLVVPPTDIPPGRFSVVTTPSGAQVTLFHEADEATAKNLPGGVGNIHWVELHSKDIDADLAWLKSVFGFSVSEMQMPNGPYYILEADGQPRGGAMTGMPEAPAMWLAWVHVANVDETIDRATSHGGKVLAPLMDVPNVGRMAIVSDPAGGVLGVITPSA